MPKVSEIFSSRYLKSEHLNGKPRILVIEGYELEDSYGEAKYVLYFEYERRGLRLSGTNAADIAKLYGDNMEEWPGHEVELYPTKMEITDRETKDKKTIDIIRARIPTSVPAKRVDDKVPF
jgi:hypothetical protein